MNSDSTHIPAVAERLRTVGLCMIVKNESHVITRCLDSVRPLIDYVLIEDTGSTDGTQDIIRDWLRRNGVAGEVVDEPWRDFAYNRTHALALLRQRRQVDYALIMDADDQVVIDEGFDPYAFKAALRDDLYDVQLRHGSARFSRPQLCLNRLEFVFKAVLHEYLEAPPGHISRSGVQGFHIETGRGGARSRNPRKYEDDAALLEQALETETDPFLISRYTFYLAQSYRDCGQREPALANYLKRAELGFWHEEVFESLYCAAGLQWALGHPAEEVLATYMRASEVSPTRAEAWFGASRFCRSQGRNEEGYQYAKRGLEIPQPTGGLFVESWIYDYGLLDELALNAYWAGHYRESLDACLRLLESPALPADQRPRIAQNARYAFDKLPREPELGAGGQSTLVNQHAVTAARPLRSRVIGSPKVLLAILAKQKAEMLPLYLECIEALDYPKSSIHLYVRTNNNTDGTEGILRDWLARVGDRYAGVEFDASNVEESVEQFAAHEWNATRFKVLGRIRNHSLGRTLDLGCDYYFVPDVDNFIRPNTLRELVALDLPIVAPLLRAIEPGRYYSNYHADIDRQGYYKHCDQYLWVLNQWIRGVVEMPVVHTTYLVRADVIPDLSYDDGSARYEYVVFSDGARKRNVPQYLDNRQVYGYIVFGKDNAEHHVEGDIETARSLLSKVLVEERGGDTIDADPPSEARPPVLAPTRATTFRPRVFGCFGQHGSGSTWMFNLVREICKAEGVPFVSVYRDYAANLPWTAPGIQLLIAKTQNPMPDFQDMIVRTNDPAVITVRDPRDAVASFLRRFPDSLARDFDMALDAIALSARHLAAVARRRQFPVFRYEDDFVGDEATADRVAAEIGVRLSPERRAAILAGLEPDAVRRTIKDLEVTGRIRGESRWDNETHWHANHVGDGKVGKWREMLTPEQVAVIASRTAEYCELFGYDLSPERAPDPAPPASRPVTRRRSRSRTAKA